MRNRPRVLFVSPQPFFEWRGSPIRVKFNTMALDQLGYDVDLLTLPIGADEPAVRARVIRVWNLFGSSTIAIGPSLLKIWFDFLLLLRGIGLVTGHRYAVLHGTEESGFLCYLLSFICRAKCIYEKHSDSGSYSEGIIKKIIIAIYNGVEHLTVRCADHVICTGPGLAEQARSVSEQAAISCIPDIPSSTLEPSPEQVAAAREEITGSSKSLVVTYVGSFAEYQGVDIIFQAIPQVLEQDPTIRFCIIGGSVGEISHYRGELEKQGIADQVMFPGKIDPDQLPAYLSASDILLAPRKSGINSPLKILDYFKAGGAIVATNTVANKRLLDAETAVLCEFDSASFASAILELSKNDARRSKIAAGGHARYRARYNFPEFTRQLGEVYDTVLKS
jgi:glycosyltransferase involved in cell wall biosynthesis